MTDDGWDVIGKDICSTSSEVQHASADLRPTATSDL